MKNIGDKSTFQTKTSKFVLTIIIIFLIILCAINSYFLFKPDSNVERAYYLNKYTQQSPANYEQYLLKHGVVASKEVIYITEDMTKLDIIEVKKGQVINTADALVFYNKQNWEEQKNKLQNQLTAYKELLNRLNSALQSVELEAATRPSNATINSNQQAENINVDVEMDIYQYHTSSEASALLLAEIAEVNKEIAIIQDNLRSIEENNALLSPINGSIGDIVFDNGKVTFEIHSSDKQIVTYLSKDEWKHIQLGNNVQIFFDEKNEPTVGTVSAKQELPAYDSIWLKQLIKSTKLKADETVYEIRIDVENLPADIPYTVITENKITIQLFNNSFISPSHWIVDKEINDANDKHIYTIGYDGKIRLEPITILSNEVNANWRVVIANEASTEEITKNDIAKKQMKDIKLQMKAEPASQTAFSLNNNETKVLLSGEDKRISANSFVQMPLQKFSFKNISLDWKDILKYIIHLN